MGYKDVAHIYWLDIPSVVKYFHWIRIETISPYSVILDLELESTYGLYRIASFGAIYCFLFFMELCYFMHNYNSNLVICYQNITSSISVLPTTLGDWCSTGSEVDFLSTASIGYRFLTSGLRRCLTRLQKGILTFCKPQLSTSNLYEHKYIIF